jgi:hypothetical protein
MSVVVKIREAKVTYDTADHIQEEDGKLVVFDDKKVVGIHPQYEWFYATVHADEELDREELAVLVYNALTEVRE